MNKALEALINKYNTRIADYQGRLYELQKSILVTESNLFQIRQMRDDLVDLSKEEDKK